MKKIYFILFGILLSTIISCQKPSINLSHKFDNDIWNSFNDIELKTKIENKKAYQIKVLITLTSDFKPSNFSFGLIQNSQEGESIYSNFIVPIKNSAGNFTEEEKGDYYIYTLIIRNKTVFNSQGEYNFIFQNLMNKYDVIGVHQLELVISEI